MHKVRSNSEEPLQEGLRVLKVARHALFAVEDLFQEECLVVQLETDQEQNVDVQLTPLVGHAMSRPLLDLQVH